MTLPNAPLAYNPSEEMPQQTADWTCSACSLAWLNRALGIQHATEEYSSADYIGIPDNINSLYGLMDASGSRLVQCLREQGAPAFSAWLDWETTLHLATSMPLLLGGVGWNHWVGCRTSGYDLLYIANSAEGWESVGTVLTEAQWDHLGPFAVVAVPLLRNFPPPPTA